MTSRQPSSSASSNSARPDFEESMTLLCEALRKMNVNNNDSDQINNLRLQVEESFLDAIQNNNNNLFRQSRLSHHFLETNNFLINNSDSFFSKILLEISASSNSANNVNMKTRNQTNHNNNNGKLLVPQHQQQKISINNAKMFFESLRNQSATLWNILETISSQQNQQNNNNVDLFLQLRCLSIDLMIASLPSPVSTSSSALNNNSFLLSTPNLLECCWMMLKTCEIISSSTSCNDDSKFEIISQIYLSSIWKIGTASSIFFSSSNNNNSNTVLSNILNSKLSSIAKERLISIAVDSLTLFVQICLKKFIVQRSSISTSIISHEQFRKNVLQHSVDYLGKNWPSLVSLFTTKCCELILEAFLSKSTTSSSFDHEIEEVNEFINLIDFTVNNLILKFPSNSAPLQNDKMICQLLIIKSKYQHKSLNQDEAALETLKQVEIRIKQQQQNNNTKNNIMNSKKITSNQINEEFLPLLCSVFGYTFKIYLNMLMTKQKSASDTSNCEQVLNEDDAASQNHHSEEIVIQNAFDTLLSLFEVVVGSSNGGNSFSEFSSSLLIQIAKGIEVLLLLSPSNNNNILLFRNHHQALTLLLRVHEKLSTQHTKIVSKVFNMIIINLCKIFK